MTRRHLATRRQCGANFSVSRNDNNVYHFYFPLENVHTQTERRERGGKANITFTEGRVMVGDSICGGPARATLHLTRMVVDPGPNHW